MLRKIKIPVLFSLVFILSSCYYDSEEYLFPQLNNECDLENITFSVTIKNILQNNCYSCHSNANAPAFGNNIRLENYSDVESQFDRVLNAVNHIQGFSPMPQNSGKLIKCSLDQLEIWNEEGKLNN